VYDAATDSFRRKYTGYVTSYLQSTMTLFKQFASTENKKLILYFRANLSEKTK
jgi:hypothetical protein